MGTLKQKITGISVIVGVMIFLLMSVTYLVKTNKELKEQVGKVDKIMMNNLQASMDSLRMIVNDQGKVEFEKQAFIYDLQKKSEEMLRESLRKQGYQLSVISDLKLQMNDLAVLVKDGETTIDSNIASYEFKDFDTSIVTTSGKTVIFLKEPQKSFTSLKMKFKPIEGLFKVARDTKTFKVMASFEPKTAGLDIVGLDTEVDASLFTGKVPVIEPKFLDNLKVGCLVGVQTKTLELPADLGLDIGVQVMYKNTGFWYMKNYLGHNIGISVTYPVSSIFGE